MAPIIPDETPPVIISWAVMAIFTRLVLVIAYQIGEYNRAVDDAVRLGSAVISREEGRKVVGKASMDAIVFFVVCGVLSAVGVSRATQGIDERMVLILEGLSRLETAAHLFAISSQTPRWIGVYFSPKHQHERVQQVNQGLDALRFHVRWSVGVYLVAGYFLNLPFCGYGRFLSAIAGLLIGFGISGVVHVARRRPAGQDTWIALALAIFLAVTSAVLFANGCSYVQRVWATGPWRNEWGLRIASFSVWSLLLLLNHIVMWRQTERKMLAERRFSTHARNQRMAVSLIFSAFRSPKKGVGQSAMFRLDETGEDDEEDDSSDNDGALTPLKSTVTTWSLVKNRLSKSTEETTALERAHWAFWILLCGLSLFIVIVNIGATAQMDQVRLKFHDVHETIYGRIDEGPVCAFDRVGGKIATFGRKEAATAAGFTIAHCGACSHCSDWHNLRLQYTTRNYLAKESARCGRKSLTGGRDAVRECLNREPIGFQGECANCWTEDIFCARAHCAFIFLQSVLINTMGNFAVGPDVITSATCEEAMCELEFVPCSGANRRRMRIQSTIQRPGTQLCSIVEADWDEIFGNGGEFYSSSQEFADQSKGEL